MIKLMSLSLVLISSSVASASLNSSWNLNSGKKHPLYNTNETLGSLEKKVFSGNTPFEKRWALVNEVAILKKDKGALEFLKKCLKQKEWFLQSAALKVLKKMYPLEAVALASVALFNSKALVVRSEAVSVISSLGGPNDTEVLWKALNQRKNFKRSKSLWIRPQIVKAILLMERSMHSQKWEGLLTDSSEEIRSIASKLVVTE